MSTTGPDECASRLTVDSNRNFGVINPKSGRARLPKQADMILQGLIRCRTNEFCGMGVLGDISALRLVTVYAKSQLCDDVK